MNTVCLPGWGMRASVFDGVMPGASDAAEPYGGSLDAFIDRLARRVPQMCDVIGWSLGAIVALGWAVRYPAQIRRLVLLAATPSFVQRADWPNGMAAPVFRTFAASVHDDRAAALRRFSLLQAGGEADGRDAARLVQHHLAGDEVDTVRLTQALHWLEETDLRAQLAAIEAPALLIHGEHDGLVPVTAGRALATMLQRATLEVIPAGHAPLLTQTAPVSQLVRKFLNER